MLLGHLSGASVRFCRLGGNKSFDCEQRQTTCQLKLDFPRVPSRAFSQGRQRRDTPLEMTDCFEGRQSRSSMLAGFQPLIDRTLSIACSSEMMRQEFRLPLDEIWEMSLKRGGHASVQLLTTRTQQRAVRHILHKCMFEQIGGMWRSATAEQ